jgi:hypothetical protein
VLRFGECRGQYGTCALPPRIEGLKKNANRIVAVTGNVDGSQGGGAQPSFGVRRDLDENTEGRGTPRIWDS